MAPSLHEALGDQIPQQSAPGCISPEQRTCPRLGGRDAGASAHHHRSAVGQGAHDAAHVLSRRDRPRGGRIEWRCGSSARLGAQPAADPARGRRDRHQQGGCHCEAGVATGTRATVDCDHGHSRRIRPLPGTDNSPDPGRPSHTRRPAGSTVSCLVRRSCHPLALRPPKRPLSPLARTRGRSRLAGSDMRLTRRRDVCINQHCSNLRLAVDRRCPATPRLGESVHERRCWPLPHPPPRDDRVRGARSRVRSIVLSVTMQRLG